MNANPCKYCHRNLRQTFTEWVVDHPGSEWVAVVMAALTIFGLIALGLSIAERANAQTAPEPYTDEVAIYVGYGTDGLSYAQQGSTVVVSPYQGPLLGLGYEHVVDPHLSLNAIGFIGSSTQSRTFLPALGMGYRW